MIAVTFDLSSREGAVAHRLGLEAGLRRRRYAAPLPIRAWSRA